MEIRVDVQNIITEREKKIIKNYIYNVIVQNHIYIYIESIMYIKLNISCTFIYTLVCTFIQNVYIANI